MSRRINIALIQMEMTFCQPDSNFQHAKELIQQAADGADVVVLPEMWNTGFFPEDDLEELSDRDGKRTREEIGGLAKKLGVNIVAGSVADCRDGHKYNSCYVFNRDGQQVARYDKTHLFSYMGEDRSFTPGDKISVFTLDGVKCGVLICYDIRFPELTRAMALTNIDLLFMVSQWPDVRIPHLEVLTQARAIENQVFFACTNASAVAGNTVYGGHSALIDPLGKVVAKAGKKEEILQGTCDLDILRTVRNTINVYRDRRPELYPVETTQPTQEK